MWKPNCGNLANSFVTVSENLEQKRFNGQMKYWDVHCTLKALAIERVNFNRYIINSLIPFY